jgi:transcriptional regulator with XRE-family HTH domain
MKENFLREARQARGISQIELAATLQIHASTLSRIERGWIKPTPEQAKRLAAFFGVSPLFLFPEPSAEAGCSTECTPASRQKASSSQIAAAIL